MLKINIGNREYSLDAEKALENGCLVPELITQIAPGDVFLSTVSVAPTPVVLHKIYSHEGCNSGWFMCGINNNPFSPFSNFLNGGSKEEIIQHLNKRKMVYLGNLVEGTKTLLKQMLEDNKPNKI